MFPSTSAEEVMKQLEPFHDQLYGIFARAVAKFNEIPPQLLLPLMRWNRSRACCIWAFAMEELELAFPPESSVMLTTKHETIEMHVGPNLVARLKKMTPGGFTSNYPTRRVRAYHDPDQAELFALYWAKPSRVDIGYILNETATGVEQVMVSHRKSFTIMDWFYTITTPDSGTPIPFAKRPTPVDVKPSVEAKGGSENYKQEPTGTEQ